MTRKLAWGLLLCFTQLTTLPGCLQLPYFSSSTTEGPKKIYEHTLNPHDEFVPSRIGQEPAGFSTAQQADTPVKTISKMPNLPSRGSGPLIIEQPGPGPTIGTVHEEIIKPKKASQGASAVVESVGEPKPLTIQPPPLPLVDKKREDALLDALKSLIEKRHDEAIQLLRVYDKETQEIIIRVLPVLTLVAQKPFSELTSQEIAIVNEQLFSALIMLRPRCELAVSKTCFCKEVLGFGWYKPLAENHAFVTGTKDRLGEEVQLYVELKNFLSEKTKDGDFVTKLACTLELQDSAGKKVWSHRFDRADAASRRSAQLNDLHRNYTFYVPAIPPGTYQLTLQITDETNPEQRRVASEKLIFRVTPVAN